VHFNSGLLYRVVGFLSLRENVSLTDPHALSKMILAHNFRLVLDQDMSTRLEIDSVLRGAELHTPEVSEATSITSQFPEVRALLADAQRTAFPDRHLVAEGRDMGTVIFPGAPLKFFVSANQAVRIQRRLAQLEVATLSSAERNLLKRKIEIEVVERDQRDSQRQASPTKAAQDGVIIDNSAGSLTEVVEKMYLQAYSRGVIPILA